MAGADEGWGPGDAGGEAVGTEVERAPFRRRHSRTQRLVLGVNVVVVLACFASAAGLLVAKNIHEDFVNSPVIAVATTTSPPVTTPTSGATPPPTDPATGDTVAPVDTAPGETFPSADPGAKNFLVTGADNKACVDPGSPWAGAADPNRPGNDRSDTIMVIRMDPDSRRAAALSFPRDLWVKVDGRGKGRINGAFVLGDPTRLVNTIYNNFGVVVDYSIQIDFCAFKQLVDAVGGVSVPFETPIFDHSINLDIPEKGCHRFSGDEALAYVRSRHLHYIDANGKERADPTADLGRVSRQQDFLRRVLSAALDKGITDPGIARALIDSMTTYIVTSNDLTIDVMLGFVGVVRDVDPSALATYQIEATGTKINGNSVLLPRLDGTNMKAILAIFRGEAPLAGAPAQEFEPATTLPGSTADTTVEPGTTAPGMPPTTVAAPEENVKGIVPAKDVPC